MTVTRISAIHRVLGPDFDLLPPEVRDAHDHEGILVVAGTADVTATKGILPWLICAIVGLPRPGAGQPVTVSLETGVDGADFWQRDFNGRRYKSRLEAGQGRHAGQLVEHQGRMTNIFALAATPERLTFTLVGFAWLGIPLPRWLAPGCEAYETSQNGKFVFDITIDAPLVGRLIGYRGETLRKTSGISA